VVSAKLEKTEIRSGLNINIGHNVFKQHPLSAAAQQHQEYKLRTPSATDPNLPKETPENSVSFKAAMESLQNERRDVLYNGCQRLNAHFEDFNDEPNLNTLCSDKYNVRCLKTFKKAKDHCEKF